MKQAVVMVSGGLDSTTVCYLLVNEGTEVHPIFFDYGQHCAETEWAKVQEVLPQVGDAARASEYLGYLQGLAITDDRGGRPLEGSRL